jgi:transposase-like protein
MPTMTKLKCPSCDSTDVSKTGAQAQCADCGEKWSVCPKCHAPRPTKTALGLTTGAIKFRCSECGLAYQVQYRLVPAIWSEVKT